MDKSTVRLKGIYTRLLLATRKPGTKIIIYIEANDKQAPKLLRGRKFLFRTGDYKLTKEITGYGVYMDLVSNKKQYEQVLYLGVDEQIEDEFHCMYREQALVQTEVLADYLLTRLDQYLTEHHPVLH